MFPTRRITTMGGEKFRDEYSLAFSATGTENDFIAIDKIALSDVFSDDDAWAVGWWFKSSRTDTGEASEVIFSMNGIDGTDRSNVVRIGCNSNMSGADVNGGIFYADNRTGNIVLTDADDPDDGTNFNDGQWHHVVVTRPSSASSPGWTNSYCYVDGNLQGYAWNVSDGTAYNSGTFRSDPSWNNAELCSIGAEWDDTPSIGDFFKGSLSELFLYNIYLSQSQVKTLYNGSEPYNHKEGIASVNLVAW